MNPLTSSSRPLEPEHTPDPEFAERLFEERDPWPWAEPYRLTGWVEREQFPPILMVVIGGLATFATFFLVSNLAMVAMLFDQIREVGFEGLEEVFIQNPNIVFAGNAVGQVVGLLMLTVAFTRLHTVDVMSFLRVRRTDPAFYVFAGVGTLALIPLASWIGHYARQLPYPEGLRQLDEQQSVLLEQIFAGEMNVGLALLFVALTPAICEEVIFRGYLQRNVERQWGAVTSIVLVGVLFGLFHMRITEMIPLSLIGIYLGYVVWVSGSLKTGILVHLLNNGIAVLASQYNQTRPEPVALDEVVMPWYLALLGLVILAALSMAMYRRRQAILAPETGAHHPT